jgi:hypothetical protein
MESAIFQTGKQDYRSIFNFSEQTNLNILIAQLGQQMYIEFEQSANTSQRLELLLENWKSLGENCLGSNGPM